MKDDYVNKEKRKIREKGFFKLKYVAMHVRNLV